MLATPAQDVAISLYAARIDDGAAAIAREFRRGYEQLSPWPVIDQRQLDGLHAARQIMLMNYAARELPRPESAAYFDKVAGLLTRLVATYAR